MCLFDLCGGVLPEKSLPRDSVSKYFNIAVKEKKSKSVKILKLKIKK